MILYHDLELDTLTTNKIIIDQCSHMDRYSRERERGGTMGCLLHKSSKFYNNIFLFVGLTTLGNLVNFDWLVNQVEFPNVSTTYFNLHNAFNVHQFIGHCPICPIPLDK